MRDIYFEKKHVLIVSGEPRVLAEIKMELMEHFDISIAAAGDTALAALEMFNIAAVVIYIGDNREKAFSVLVGIFEFITGKKIPIIFLAEKGNEDDETAAFMLGAADYAVRRQGALNAFISRIELRIKAGEYERQLLSNENFSPSSTLTPEVVLNHKTILVADDIALNRDIVAGMLSEIEGLTLEFAADGKETVDKFSENPSRYSLILMDIQMPVMNGLDATRAIRGLPCENARAIPIVALTASAEEDEIKICFEAGMNDYIEKPMAYDKLLGVIAEHCLQ